MSEQELKALPPVTLDSVFKLIHERFSYDKPKPVRPAYRRIGEVQISICRDHEGDEYEIPVLVDVTDVSDNRGETDRDEEVAYYVELGWAFITETIGPFKEGTSIDLTTDEEDLARETYIEEQG